MDQTADLTFLRTFTGGDPAKMKKYITLFLNGAAPGMESIKTCFAGSDWPGLKTAAHSLKSQVKYMGIKEAEALSFYIEQQAGSQTELEKLPDAIQKLETVTGKACDELRAELDAL